MIKVLHVITEIETGGAERMLTRLVTRSSSSVEHFVVSMVGAGQFGEDIKRAGVPLVTLGMRRGRPSLGCLLQLIAIIRREKPDVLLTWLYHADLMGRAAAWFCKVPRVVWNLRCSDMDMSHYSRLSKLVLNILAKLSPGVDAVIANSHAGQKVHEQLGYKPPQWTVLPNGFDLDVLHPSDARRDAFRKELGVGKDQLIVGMVARVDPMKDHVTFLDAAQNIVREKPDTVFALIGTGCDQNGPLVDLIKDRKLQDNVRLLGERFDVPEIMPGFDIGVLSSLSEGFPNVVGEMMASAVPVVATDVGDSRIIVGDAGEIVPPRDVEEMTAAILRIMALSAPDRQAMGMAACRRIETEYQIEKIEQRYTDFFKTLLGRS